MPRPRLQRADTVRQEKFQLPIAEQNFVPIDYKLEHRHSKGEQGYPVFRGPKARSRVIKATLCPAARGRGV